ncbi:hypothetical protein GBA52_022703 [Prunus armeniaca]|nr:hypothetical protein GBA52_022703 [Prunus armeniaca]
MNNQSNLKSSYIEIVRDDACIQPQPQPQQQHIALPPLVEDMLNKLCNERKQPQPDYDVRRRLGLLGEKKALQLLHEIDKEKVIKTLSGFIMWMIPNKPQYQCPSPSKYAPASLLQTQLSASPFTPSVHKDGGAEMWREAVLGKYCECGKQAILRTSWTDFNPGRRFYVCGTQGFFFFPNSSMMQTSRRCDLWEWADPKMCDRSKQIIPVLLRQIKTMEEELQLQRAKNKEN